jgi:hypothetical protein
MAEYPYPDPIVQVTDVQDLTVPDAEVMFTGDLVETGQFAIFPWSPAITTSTGRSC